MAEDIKKEEQEETNENVVQEKDCQSEENSEEINGGEKKEEAQETVVIDERDEKIEDLQNRLLRLQADFDNYRRRTNEEQAQLAGFVSVGIIEKFLRVLDNFERAEQSLENATDGATIKTGLEKIRKQFEKALSELKVEEIKAKGEQFDPAFHEAIMRGENPDLPDDTVEMVLEKGYKIGDRIIRHSKVKVVNNS